MEHPLWLRYSFSERDSMTAAYERAQETRLEARRCPCRQGGAWREVQSRDPGRGLVCKTCRESEDVEAEGRIA